MFHAILSAQYNAHPWRHDVIKDETLMALLKGLLKETESDSIEQTHDMLHVWGSGWGIMISE